MNWISKDGKIILLNCGILSFGYGFISVLLGIYLKELGFEPFLIGLLLSTAIIGGALFSIITGRYAVIYGLKKMPWDSHLHPLPDFQVFFPGKSLMEVK